MSTILKTINITKTYSGNDYKSLTDFNIEIIKGQITALLGESGCGKTTALRIIAGFEFPDKGTVIINNKIMTDDNTFIEPNKRGVGIVFQDYALFPNKTVLKNITFGLDHLSRQNKQETILKVLALTGMQNFTTKYPHQLSGGQSQRVALARALAANPQILLMDEPFSNIDSLKKNQMRQEIRDILKKAESTAIFVTHNTKDVLSIADKVIVMRKGRVLQVGSPHNVYSRPVNEYVANFFGKTNTLHAIIKNNKIESDIGIFPYHNKNSDYRQNVILSIRPKAFRLSHKNNGITIPVEVKKRTFMGDHIELICTTQKQKTELIVHLNPDSDNNIAKKNYLSLEPKNIHIMQSE